MKTLVTITSVVMVEHDEKMDEFSIIETAVDSLFFNALSGYSTEYGSYKTSEVSRLFEIAKT